MSKGLRTAALIVGAVALIATGVGAAAGAGLLTTTVAGTTVAGAFGLTAATLTSIGALAGVGAAVLSLGAQLTAKKSSGGSDYQRSGSPEEFALGVSP